MEIYLFFKLIFVVANFIWFFSLNNNFERKYPNYHGKMWGFLFFPTYLISFSIFSIGTWIILSFSGFINFMNGTSFIIIGIILTIALCVYFNRLKECLFNWDGNSKEKGLQFFTIIAVIGLTFNITNTIFFYQMFKYVWNTVVGQLLELFWFIIWFIEGIESKAAFPAERFISQLIQYQVFSFIVYIIFYVAGKNKLKTLNSIILSTYSSSFNSPEYFNASTGCAVSAFIPVESHSLPPLRLIHQLTMPPNL